MPSLTRSVWLGLSSHSITVPIIHAGSRHCDLAADDSLALSSNDSSTCLNPRCPRNAITLAQLAALGLERHLSISAHAGHKTITGMCHAFLGLPCKCRRKCHWGQDQGKRDCVLFWAGPLLEYQHPDAAQGALTSWGWVPGIRSQ